MVRAARDVKINDDTLSNMNRAQKASFWKPCVSHLDRMTMSTADFLFAELAQGVIRSTSLQLHQQLLQWLT